jgi:hypothetical protein
MDPATATLIAAAIGAGGSIGGGILSKSGQKETKLQKTKRNLIDQLIASLSGQGPYSDLFSTDEAAFKKSFIDPAKSTYKNQIAPQIQQSYIASGQQRGTAMEDQLLRAGVDLDQMLNQNYLTFQNQGKDRMANILNSILGQGSGAPAGAASNPTGQAIGGFLSSDAAKDLTKAGLGYYDSYSKAQEEKRKGFENEQATA